jgi:hypothetical protein
VARSRNMQRLTEQMQARHPGMVIYGIGDKAHQGSPSGHNEDDTPGSRPEQEDPDSKREHRAIDLMIGPKFTVTDAWNHVAAMVQRPENQARLYYVIFFRKIWRRNGGWREEVYTGSDPHTNHVHDSGNWPDDENTSDWLLDAGGSSAPVVTGGKGMSNFMMQRNGDPTIYLCSGFEYRELSDWNDFLLYRDTFKWPYVVVPDAATFARRAGRYYTADEAVAAPALLTEEQMTRIELAAQAGAQAGGGIPADVLRTVLDEEAISLGELQAAAAGVDGSKV